MPQSMREYHTLAIRREITAWEDLRRIGLPNAVALCGAYEALAYDYADRALRSASIRSRGTLRALAAQALDTAITWEAKYT